MKYEYTMFVGKQKKNYIILLPGMVKCIHKTIGTKLMKGIGL